MKVQLSVVKSNLWMESPSVALSLACCPETSSRRCGGKLVTGFKSTETQAQLQTIDLQVGSATTGELTRSSGRRQEEENVVSFMDWSSVRSSVSGSTEKRRGAERMGSGMSVVTGSGVDSDGGGGGEEEVRKYSVLEQVKMPSSQYKGVVPQPNGRWGAQIYEKHQRVWLGTFNREEDAAMAYDRVVLKFRGRDAITNFRPFGEDDPEARFMREHSTGEIVGMLRRHTYDQEFNDHSKKSSRSTMAVRAINGGGENEGRSGNINTSSPSSDSPPRDHLFDKAVTPSDVGKLNRLVIPKQQAEKHFPLHVNSSDNGLLLNFEDNTGKVWRFRYSYWNSSQSYVLTKGWSRFVKEKKLEAGDIVSFHRGSADSAQLYITWRRSPIVQQPRRVQSKRCNLNPFQSSQRVAAYNPLWVSIFSPTSKSPLGHMEAAARPTQISAVPLYISALAETCDSRSFYNICPDGFPDLSIAVEKPPEKKEGPPSLYPAAKKKKVRLFGVNLAESQRLPGELILFPS